MNVRRIGRSFFQLRWRYMATAVNSAVKMASRPESAVASAYEGIRCGSTVIRSMPKPNPLIRCTMDAAKVNTISSMMEETLMVKALLNYDHLTAIPILKTQAYPLCHVKSFL